MNKKRPGRLFSSAYNIGGLKIVNIENKLSQFANDTAILLNGTEFSLQKSLEELNRNNGTPCRQPCSTLNNSERFPLD
jgi:hypothetical protein